MPWRKLGGKYIAYEILDQATVIYEGMIKTCARHVNDKCKLQCIAFWPVKQWKSKLNWGWYTTQK